MGKKKVLLITAAVAIIIAVAAVIWAGRRTNDTDNEIPGASEWFLTYNNDSYSSLGRLYADNGYLHFLDAGTGEEQLVCDDATCAHGRDECSAYFDAIILQGIVEKDKLLLITNYEADRFGELYLYEAALNGGQRKRLARLSDNVQTIIGATVTDDYIAIAYCNTYDENGEQTDESTAGILLYNRTNGQSEDIVQITMWNALIYFPRIIGNQVYYEYLGYEMDKEDAIAHAEDMDYYQERLICKLAVYNLEEENSGAEDISDIDTLNPLMLYNDSIFYVADQQLYGYNTKTKELEALGEAMQVVPGDGKEGIYLTRYNAQDRITTLYRYDGTVQYVREYTNEWNICAAFENTIYAWHYDGENNNGRLNVLHSNFD